MENILTLNNTQNVLSQEEIETLFKGFIKLVEKNTEQKLKNNLKNEQFKKLTDLPVLNISTVKDLEEVKQTALKIFDENVKLKKQIEREKLKILELRSLLVKNNWDIISIILWILLNRLF